MSVLTDSYNRKIDYLRLSVTDRCNLRCLYCMPPQGVKAKCHEEILSYEEIEFIVKCAIKIGISKIRLTGGEPLVRKDLIKLVKSLSQASGLNDISLTTNGLLLADYAVSLAEAGLKRVNISIDSLDPEIYRRLTRGGDLARALDGLEAALEAGLTPVKINVVPIKGINDNLKPFVDLIYKYPIHVRFIEYMPIGEGNFWSQEMYIPGIKIKEQLLALGELKRAPSPIGAGPAIYYQFPGALGTLGLITPISRHFCPSCNRLRITADGKLRLCLFSNDEINLLEVIRRGATVKQVCQLIKSALKRKPLRHNILEKNGNRTMSQIGG